jgi:uncharacterized protein (TIGR02453 family)
MSFQGWPPAALEFYQGLEADNSKAYWLAHKGVYEQKIKAPMDALLADLTEEFGEVHPFRPYRDIRFSSDKSPYKTAIAATVGSMYVHLSAEGLRADGGMYHMAPDQLDRYRDAVAADDPGEVLRDIVDALTAAGIEVYGSDPLKSVPKGHDRDHPRVELLRYRGIVAMKAWPAAPWLATPGARQRVVDVFRTVAPLAEWLDDHVGPTSEPVGKRGRR